MENKNGKCIIEQEKFYLFLFIFVKEGKFNVKEMENFKGC